MVHIREIRCKTALSRSKIMQYSLNPYTGCAHGCRYCYARFITKFTGHTRPWGSFLDVKINIPDVLSKEVTRKKPGRVFVCSVCDGWQPAEERYELTRRCIDILCEGGFAPSILTKSGLVTRDYDILGRYPDCEIGFTITTLDEEIRRALEPNASPSLKRVAAMREAADRGIRTYAFIGPLLPFLCDGEENIDEIFRTISDIGLERIYVDKLNLRYGVWRSVASLLSSRYPQLLGRYRKVLFTADGAESYRRSLSEKAVDIASKYGLSDKLVLVF